MKVLNETFDKYSLDKIFLSFNGGKDCTVLLHMVDSVLKKRKPNHDENVDNIDDRILCLYIQPAEPFVEVENFVEQCRSQYRINVQIPRDVSTSMKQALQVICDENSKLAACLMGCRRTDPYCDKLLTFDVIYI